MKNDRFTKTRRMILYRGLLAPFITLMLVCGILVYYFAAYSREQVEAKLVRIASDHRQLIDQGLFFNVRLPLEPAETKKNNN